MPKQNVLRQARIVLYRLARNYSAEVVFTYIEDQEFDVTTGSIAQVNHRIVVKRAIVLPYSESRDFAYDLSYIAANKNFTYGGFFDKKDRVVIVKNSDIKIQNTNEQLQINENWLADYDGYEYHVRGVQPLEVPGHTLIKLTGVSPDVVEDRPKAVVEPLDNSIDLTTGLTGST